MSSAPPPSLARPVVVGAGPVGRAVAAHLVELGAEPTLVTRSGATLPGTASIAADVTDPAAAVAALQGATVVFQCAQPAYHRWVAEFRPMQDAILAGCESAGAALVATENVYGYGIVDGPMTEATPLAGPPPTGTTHTGTTRKGRVRADAWRDLAAAHRAGRVPTAAVRASDFFGPGVTESAFGERFFAPLVAGGKAQHFGSPELRHSVTFVPDLARALVAIGADPDRWGRAWHAPNALLDGQAPTIGRLVELAAAAAGSSARSRRVAPWMLRLAGIFQPGARELIEMLYEFDRDFVVDASESERVLGLAPTPLPEALAATVDWYRRRAPQ